MTTHTDVLDELRTGKQEVLDHLFPVVSWLAEFHLDRSTEPLQVERRDVRENQGRPVE